MNCCLQVYRFVFQCSRRIMKLFYEETVPIKEAVSSSNLPWVWIGVETPEYTHSVTDVVNKYIQHGDVITNQLINEITGLKCDKWTYIDTKTFSVKEFPSEGILIE